MALPENLELQNKVEIIPYFSQALGEKEAAIVMLRAERDMLVRQLQVMKLELDALKERKKDRAEKTQ